MAFKISDIEYTNGTNREPDAMGFIEGYTSNTVGKTFLRLNIKSLVDEEIIDWNKRLFKALPLTADINKETLNSFLREIRVGDIVGEGVRLNRKQVF
jgi:hypothetical protein